MKHDSILWNPLVEIPEKEYIKNYGYLFDKEEYLSDKLKRYNINSAQNDIKNELTPYHFFIAKARESFINNITVYKLSNEIIEKIQNTTIEEIPKDTPQIFKGNFIIETHDNNSNLFGDINSIVGSFHNLTSAAQDKLEAKYMLTLLLHTQNSKDENWYKTAIKINQLARNAKVMFSYLGANLFSLVPPLKDKAWKFDKIDYSRNVLMDTNYCNTCKHSINCQGPARPDDKCNYNFCFDGICDSILSFITIFNYMLEAENSPIETKKKINRTSFIVNKKGKIIEKKQEWITKYLYLDKTKIQYEKSEEHTPLDKENLNKKNVNVKGHLRYQACGAGMKDRKLIYIESHVTTKWVKDGDTKIIVDMKKDEDS